MITGSTRELNIKFGSHRFGFSEDTWSGWLMDDGRITPESVISYVELGPLGKRQIPISIDAAAVLLALFFVTLLLMVALAVYSWRRSRRPNS